MFKHILIKASITLSLLSCTINSIASADPTTDSCTKLEITRPLIVTMDNKMIKVIETKTSNVIWSKNLYTFDGNPTTGALLANPEIDREGNLIISYQIKSENAWPWFKGTYQQGSNRFIEMKHPYFPAYEHIVAKINPKQNDFVWKTRVEALEFDSKPYNDSQPLNEDYGFHTVYEKSSTKNEQFYLASHSHNAFRILQYPALGNGDNMDAVLTYLLVNADTGAVVKTYKDSTYANSVGYTGEVLNSRYIKRNEMMFSFLNKNSIDDLLTKKNLKLKIYENYQDNIYTYDQDIGKFSIGTVLKIESKPGNIVGWFAELFVSLKRDSYFTQSGETVHVYFDKNGNAKTLFVINSGKSSFDSRDLFLNTVRFTENGKIMYGGISRATSGNRPDLATHKGWELETGKEIWTNNDFYIVDSLSGHKIFIGEKSQELPGNLVLLKDKTNGEIIKELNPLTGKLSNNNIKPCH